VEILIEELPKRQLNSFADAFRRLIFNIENLRFCHQRNPLLCCTNHFCRWKDIEISLDEPKERCFSDASFGALKNLMIFEIKLSKVSNNEYRLKQVLGDSYESGRPMLYSMRRFKKALDIYESGKINTFAERIDQFVNIIYREAFILLESLPGEESDELRRSLHAFNRAAWEMREVEDKLKEDWLLRCCNVFRKQRQCDTEVQAQYTKVRSEEDEESSSSSDSTFSYLCRCEYMKTNPSPLVNPVLRHKGSEGQNVVDYQRKSAADSIQTATYEQCKPTANTKLKCSFKQYTDATVKDNTNDFLDQCKPTATDKSANPPKQYSPTAKVRTRYNLVECENSSNDCNSEPQELGCLSTRRPNFPSEGAIKQFPPEHKNGNEIKVLVIEFTDASSEKIDDEKSVVSNTKTTSDKVNEVEETII
jgi:hypothetical protein